MEGSGKQTRAGKMATTYCQSTSCGQAWSVADALHHDTSRPSREAQASSDGIELVLQTTKINDPSKTAGR